MFRCLVILFLLLFAGCASGVYSHYPKVKHQAKSEGHQPTQTKKQFLVIETLELKRVEKQTIAIIPPTKADFILVNQPYTTSKQITKPTQRAAIEGDGRPRDATHYNKNAKVAFAAAIGALAFLGGGLLIHPAFLIAMFLCTLLAFVKGIKAIRKIMKTGEYGRYKAEFALYVAIPLLFLSIVGLFAYLSANGTGLQIGNVFIP
jgi:hypothetical protein